MPKSKVLLSVAFSCCFSWLCNPSLAEETYYQDSHYQYDYSTTEETSYKDSRYEYDYSGYEESYLTDDLLGDTSTYWSGCYTLNEGWAGYSGGSCPTINDQYDGTINYGYVERTLTNLAAIDQALKGVGLETTGYTYSWMVKNKDAERNQNRGTDTFDVRVIIKDSSGNEVYSKTFDYSQTMDWTYFAGVEDFEKPYQLDEIDAIGIQITGKDVGYWAGYYGPEFRQPDVRLIYRESQNVAEEDTTVDDMLFDQMCQQDPLYDMSCPNYQTAMIDEISSTSTFQEDDISNTVPAATTNSFDGTATNEITAMGNVEVSTTETFNEPSSDPVAEQTIVVEPSVSEESKSTGLNSDQLAALDRANSAVNAAQASSANAAAASAGVGLSSDGGISSELSSDGVTNANGSLTSSIASNIGSDTGTSTNNTSESSQTSDGSSINGSRADGQITDLGVVNQSGQTDVNSTNSFSDTNLLTYNDTNSQSELAGVTSIIDSIINEVTNNLIQAAANQAEEIAEESSEESFEDQNAIEDQLVEKALQGDTSEDAQAALLGYNPNFRAYQQPQMADNLFYTPKDIYTEAKNYDNPNARFFNGASETKHKEMVRSQYD